MRIDTQDPFVRERIQSIARQVVYAGGYVHPELTIHQRGADLWTSFPRALNPWADQRRLVPHPQAPVVLAVPDELFVPVTELRWHPSSDGLQYSGSTDGWSPAHKEILQDFVALFNALEKVRVVGTAYAGQSMGEDPELVSLIKQARPVWRGTNERQMEEEWAGRWHPEDTWSPAHSVISSRLTTRRQAGSEDSVGCYMPLLDFLNHHPFGSPYQRDAKGRWIVIAHHPSATDQMFLRYNRADAFGIALGLGYAEDATRHVVSVAARFDVPDIGEVRLRGVAVAPRHIPAPRVVETRRGLIIGGLAFQPGGYQSLRTLLGMPLSVCDPQASADVIQQRATTLLDTAVAANLDYFAELEQLCTAPAGAGARPRDPGYATTSHGSGLRAVFLQVARHQQALLKAFSTGR